MTKLEEIARAAYERMHDRASDGLENTGEPFFDGDWNAQPQVLRDDWIDSIRAVVEAMREPGEAVMKAPIELFATRDKEWTFSNRKALWIGMVNAILNEKPE